MAKFYVQSGSVRSIVQAESSRKAALWAVHQTMQQVLPMESESNSTKNRERLPADTVAVLSSRVKVSEQGFDREDATTMETLEVVSEWNQMVTTLDRLEKMLYRAA